MKTAHVLIIYAFALLTAPAFGQDVSRLLISAGSYSGDPKIQFAVSNPLNQKCGYDPVSKSVREEIPGASYGWTRLGDPESGPDENDYTTLEFSNNAPLIAGIYSIVFYGLEDTPFLYSINSEDNAGNSMLVSDYKGYVSSGAILSYKVYLDPTPGASKPVIDKTVTFDVVRQDLAVAQKLGQLGEDKFTNSLLKQLSQAEKLNAMCDKRRGHEKAKGCGPAASVLKLFVKRLEFANKKCDKPEACDEERPWTAFRKEHGRDHDYDDFFRDWDRDDWHKWKNKSKRFVTDEALGIIKGDAEILLQDLVGEVAGHGKGKK